MHSIAEGRPPCQIDKCTTCKCNGAKSTTHRKLIPDITFDFQVGSHQQAGWEFGQQAGGEGRILVFESLQYLKANANAMLLPSASRGPEGV